MSLLPFRSWQRPSPCRAPASRCPSTWASSPHAARAATTRRSGSRYACPFPRLVHSPLLTSPVRSQAVQLAYSNPRCRVLVFRTRLDSNVEVYIGGKLTWCCACSQTLDDSSEQVQLYPNDRDPRHVSHIAFYVCSGTGGGAAARVAIGRAQRQLAVEGGVNLHVRNFAVRLVVAPFRPILLTNLCSTPRR